MRCIDSNGALQSISTVGKHLEVSPSKLVESEKTRWLTFERNVTCRAIKRRSNLLVGESSGSIYLFIESIPQKRKARRLYLCRSDCTLVKGYRSMQIVGSPILVVCHVNRFAIHIASSEARFANPIVVHLDSYLDSLDSYVRILDVSRCNVPNKRGGSDEFCFIHFLSRDGHIWVCFRSEAVFSYMMESTTTTTTATVVTGNDESCISLSQWPFLKVDDRHAASLDKLFVQVRIVHSVYSV